MSLWGGRFTSAPDDSARRLLRSLPFDYRLLPFDIAGSIAHAQMLGQCGIIPSAEAQQLADGLRQLLREAEAGALDCANADDEDVHSFVERVLTQRVGEVGGKLHTARSRNDQIALDERLYVRAMIRETGTAVLDLARALADQAEAHIATVMPGRTHMQHAQPVTLAHHLLAYVWMLDRDLDRLANAHRRANSLPLGAAALAGTPFPIDRQSVADLLRFERVIPNSLDAVSDRDFMVEFAFDLTLLLVHLSRLCEELVLWSAQEFGFLEFDDAYATGSSIMPQKKNPDVAELIRGKSGRGVGVVAQLLTMLKGLPLAYNTDMQEDKEGLFDLVDTAGVCLSALTGAVSTATFDPERMRAALDADGFITATDLADHLASRGLPFRQAHEIVGRVVLHCIDTGKELAALTRDELSSLGVELQIEPAELLSVDASLRSRSCCGGPAPEAVGVQLDEARRQLDARASEFQSLADVDWQSLRG